jgi:hypothetical protein
LTTLLSQNGISLPPEFFGEEISHNRGLRVHTSNLSTRNNNLANEPAQSATGTLVDLQLAAAGKSVIANQSGTGSSLFARDRRPQITSPTATAISPSTEPSGQTCLSELDVTIVGMEFVLTYVFCFVQFNEEETNKRR